MPARSRSAMPACSRPAPSRSASCSRRSNAPFWVTLPAAALVGALLGIIFGLPSLRLRGLYLAVSTLALHFVVVYLGGEYETQARLLDRHHDRSAEASAASRSPTAALWYFILLAARGADAADLPQSAAQPHRPRLARDPRARDRRRSARHRHRRLQAARLRHQLGDHGGRRRAVRLLPRLRVGRGVLAVPHRSSTSR